MRRKEFIKKGLFGLVGIPTVASACEKNGDGADVCVPSPNETAGPFPIKTPSELVRENIISDRKGIALLINLTVQSSEHDCGTVDGVFVDIWHCDAQGNYSEYNGFNNRHFLRGRQTTDSSGRVSFISIFPGWYPGRAPHIHVEVLDANEKSLKITQVAFPEAPTEEVYSTEAYRGTANTSNQRDGVFRNSLDENMADSLTGNLADGYILEKTIVV